MQMLSRAEHQIAHSCSARMLHSLITFFLQANAVADKVLDLRQCKYPGADFSAKVLSGGLMSDADFSNTKLVETVLTKVRGRRCDSTLALQHVNVVSPGFLMHCVLQVYAVGANFEGA